MKRKLIDRESALQIMADAGQEYHEDGDFVRFVSAVINMQTAAARIVALPTVEERRRGRFIKEVIPYEGRRTITCSECGKELSTGPVIGVNYFRRGWRYCPYCGAEMENAEGEE